VLQIWPSLRTSQTEIVKKLRSSRCTILLRLRLRFRRIAHIPRHIGSHSPWYQITNRNGGNYSPEEQICNHKQLVIVTFGLVEKVSMEINSSGMIKPTQVTSIVYTVIVRLHRGKIPQKSWVIWAGINWDFSVFYLRSSLASLHHSPPSEPAPFSSTMQNSTVEFGHGHFVRNRDAW
jgi:hypothetical protein